MLVLGTSVLHSSDGRASCTGLHLFSKMTTVRCLSEVNLLKACWAKHYVGCLSETEQCVEDIFAKGLSMSHILLEWMFLYKVASVAQLLEFWHHKLESRGLKRGWGCTFSPKTVTLEVYKYCVRVVWKVANTILTFRVNPSILIAYVCELGILSLLFFYPSEE